MVAEPGRPGMDMVMAQSFRMVGELQQERLRRRRP